MSERNLGQEVLESIVSIKEGRPGRVHVRVSPEAIRSARAALNVSQTSFAALLNVPVGTLRSWEQGTRRPSGPALPLLAIAAARPTVIREVFLGIRPCS